MYRNGWTQIIPFAAILLIASCATGLEAPGANDTTTRIRAALNASPEPGHALVVFLRPSEFETRFDIGSEAALYDGERYIGIVKGETRLHYQALPGSHLFMAFDTLLVGGMAHAMKTATNADFVRGEVVAGKTYVVVLRPRRRGTMGIYRGPHVTARAYDFLVAGHGTPIDKLIEWIGSSEVLEQTGKYATWDNRNRRLATLMRKNSLPVWESRLVRAEFGQGDAY